MNPRTHCQYWAEVVRDDQPSWLSSELPKCQRCEACVLEETAHTFQFLCEQRTQLAHGSDEFDHDWISTIGADEWHRVYKSHWYQAVDYVRGRLSNGS